MCMIVACMAPQHALHLHRNRELCSATVTHELLVTCLSTCSLHAWVQQEPESAAMSVSSNREYKDFVQQGVHKLGNA